MPKRGGRGGRQNIGSNRELVFKVEGETDYAQVVKNLGNKRLETIVFSSGRTIQCKIRGSLRTWISIGDIVLVGMRDFQEEKGDIVWKYSTEEARKLKKSGEIPTSTKINETDNTISGGENIDFVEESGNQQEDDIPCQRNYDMPSDDSDIEDIYKKNDVK